MFNDILTGKASLEPTPEGDGGGPYRKPQVPQVSVTCVDCKKPYAVPANTPPGRCALCHVRFAEANTPMNVRANDWQERQDQSHRVFRVVVGIAIAVGVAIFRVGMRHSMEEDARGSYSYQEPVYDDKPYDPALEPDVFSAKISSFADQMCACADRDCAWRVENDFELWSRANQAPTDEATTEAVIRHMKLFTSCLDRMRPSSSTP